MRIPEPPRQKDDGRRQVRAFLMFCVFYGLYLTYSLFHRIHAWSPGETFLIAEFAGTWLISSVLLGFFAAPNEPAECCRECSK